MRQIGGREGQRVLLARPEAREVVRVRRIGRELSAMADREVGEIPDEDLDRLLVDLLEIDRMASSWRNEIFRERLARLRRRAGDRI